MRSPITAEWSQGKTSWPLAQVIIHRAMNFLLENSRLMSEAPILSLSLSPNHKQVFNKCLMDE